MSTLPNKVNRLDWNIPIVTPNGTPTDEFMRKWLQQQATNSSIPNLTTAGAVSAVLDLISAAPGSLLERGAAVWSGLASPADATMYLNGAALPAYAHVKDSDLSLSDITTNNVSTAAHGFAPKAPNDATKFLDGTGAYSVPAGGSSGAPGSAMDDGTNFYLAMIDSAGQLVLDAFGDPIFGIEVLPTTAIPALPYAPSTLPTRQVLTAGSAATYTTPASCRQLRIRMAGGGGGGGGSSTGAIPDGGNGGNGGDTIFNGIHAAGGLGASQNQAFAGGTGGTGSASVRMPGEPGTWAVNIASAANELGGNGGGSTLGGGGLGQPSSRPGVSALPNTGGGGGGGGVPAGATSVAGGGGSGAEYAELIINTPTATYIYTIGALGSAGAAGTGGQTGGAGGTGIIIVDEDY